MTRDVDLLQLETETIWPPDGQGRLSGPHHLVIGAAADGHTAAVGAAIVRSDSTGSAALRGANPGNWQADEWSDLLAGRLGPWAMATHGDTVIAICHTPAQSDHAAEAGTWTHPNFRGRGHAAATTAAWASLFAGRRQQLFHSTSAANRSSQRVAARLGLRLIGWLWKVSPAGTGS